MKKRVKQLLVCCLLLAMCVCNVAGTTVTSQAASKKAKAITLNTKQKSLTVGQTYQLKVKKVKPSKASKSVTWKSSNSKVAKVNSKGKVTARKAGKATITAISKTNKKVKAACKITVYSKPTKVSLNYSSKEIKEGESFQLKVTVVPKKAKQTVTYSSSNSAVATVDNSGKVTGKKEGKAAITVVSTTNKEKKAKCVVYVKTANKGGEATTVTATPTPTPTPTPTGPPSYAGVSAPIICGKEVHYSRVYFGNYPQSDATGQTKEPIRWRVLAVNGTKALLMSDQILEVYRYNEKGINVTWETSTIRSWLNGYGSEVNAYGKDYRNDNFIDRAFTSVEQAAIPYVKVVNEDNPEYGTEGGNDTVDKIYLLSISEASNVNYGFSSYLDENNEESYDVARRLDNTAYTAAGGILGAESYSYIGERGIKNWWWLRSPGRSFKNTSYIAQVDKWGRGDIEGSYDSMVNNDGGVCPVLYLDLSVTEVWSKAPGITIVR